MLPPETPVRPSVFIPRARAVYRALRTLPEFPEVLMAQSKSLAFPYPQTCWAKTYSGPMSLEIAVHRAVCAHKETARIPSCSFAPNSHVPENPCPPRPEALATQRISSIRRQYDRHPPHSRHFHRGKSCHRSDDTPPGVRKHSPAQIAKAVTQDKIRVTRQKYMGRWNSKSGGNQMRGKGIK